MNVLVTGGSGFLGRRLQKYKSEWNYVSSTQYNLINSYDCERMFSDFKPDAVVHLAARVGGIKENFENQAEFFYQNVMMNTNIIHAAHQAEIPRVLSALSTCAFPDKMPTYPFNEFDLLRGPPAETNLSYGYAKRMLHIQCVSHREQYGVNYSTFCPSNLYGPDDHFDSENSHFVSSLISKVAKLNDGDTLELWGTGRPLRQQLYVDDMCRIIPILLEEHNSDVPLIVAPDENLSINEMANILIKQLNKNIKIVYNNQLDGQFRKDGSNKRFLELVGDFKFTPFDVGVEKTIKWYLENK
jgi:GDP-L-fucose synthase